MILSTLAARRRARNLARVGAVCSLTMLCVGALSALNARALPAGSVPTAGQTTPTSGDSSTAFAIGLTAPNNVCPGDTATGNYRWTTYMVPAAVDPATLTYNSNGPIKPTGVTFAQPLFSSTGSPQVNKATGLNDGLVTPIPSFSFSVFEASPGSVPTGEYKIGFACTLAGATERYWGTQISVTASTTAFTWSTVPFVVPGTTTTTTTTTIATTTTTTIKATTTSAASTSTTAASSTTSSVSATSTTAAATPSATTTVSAAAGAGTGTQSNGRTLANTGTSTWPLVIWALLLIVFGRMAILMARPVSGTTREDR